jgi:dihydroorotate dehydrogenase electron transfer subunit
MLQKNFPITNISILNPSIVKFHIHAPELSNKVLPGQFINIKIDETHSPLLRRPFSVHYVDGDEIEIVFGVQGMGTKKLNTKKVGDHLDVIGPLGRPFEFTGDEKISVLIGGGLGAVPLPLLSEKLKNNGKQVVTFLGARTKDLLIQDRLENLHYATDDGTQGYHGNIVDLFKKFLEKRWLESIKIYCCGPTQMLKAISKLMTGCNVPCEVSVETTMACGFGICQGCAVKANLETEKFLLACKDGPVFKIADIVL